MNQYNVIYGIHEHLRIAKAPDPTLIGKALIDVGALGEGDYEAVIDSQGLGEIDVHLLPSAVSGSFAPTLEALFLDRTARDSDAGSNFAAATPQTLSLTSLKGTFKCRLKFTVPAAGSITFSRAEVQGL